MCSVISAWCQCRDTGNIRRDYRGGWDTVPGQTEKLSIAWFPEVKRVYLEYFFFSVFASIMFSHVAPRQSSISQTTALGELLVRLLSARLGGQARRLLQGEGR